jgi:hypothetical protein
MTKEQDPDLLVSVMDLRIHIQIQNKMSWIRNNERHHEEDNETKENPPLYSTLRPMRRLVVRERTPNYHIWFCVCVS